MSDDFEYVDSGEVALADMQVFQQDKALIDTQIATAKRWPRNLKRCIDNAITIVTMDEEVASSCTYSLSKGGKTIVGPSVVLAKILLKQLGNIRADQRVVGYDDKHVTCQATVFDLEKNFALRTTIKKSLLKSATSGGGRVSEDMATIIGNAGNAIALRNAAFAVIDENVIKKVWDSAKKRITGNLSDETKLVARRTTLINGIKDTYPDMKLTDEEIARSVGKSSIDHITADDILIIIGFVNNMKSGEQQPAEIFRPMTINRPVPPQSKDKEKERLITLINAAATKEALAKLLKECNTEDERNAYDAKLKTFIK